MENSGNPRLLDRKTSGNLGCQTGNPVETTGNLGCQTGNKVETLFPYRQPLVSPWFQHRGKRLPPRFLTGNPMENRNPRLPDRKPRGNHWKPGLPDRKQSGNLVSIPATPSFPMVSTPWKALTTQIPDRKPHGK